MLVILFTDKYTWSNKDLILLTNARNSIGRTCEQRREIGIIKKLIPIRKKDKNLNFLENIVVYFWTFLWLYSMMEIAWYNTAPTCNHFNCVFSRWELNLQEMRLLIKDFFFFCLSGRLLNVTTSLPGQDVRFGRPLWDDNHNLWYFAISAHIIILLYSFNTCDSC